MKFEYKFVSRWVVDGFIEINSQRSSFNGVTYVTDCLGDLLSALLHLNVDCISKDDGLKTNTSCEWNSEPYITTWNFTLRTNGMLHVIVTNDGKEEDEDIVDIDTECPYDSLLEIIVLEVDSLIKKHGIVGYKENWDYEFPLSTFLKLKNYLINKKPYLLNEIGDEYGEIKISNLHKDIELFLK
ncbi:hypothetical protein [Peribacillus asahii]|uniref:Uncharacterized protein n=1 Tax=Peribacillus asahii TaxID=228899 RepID=A0A3T0KRD0_9BACI|nr:hypothetical protein [Peribacillus asahii]AZV42947.1 hypothetical protein BAOM_2338 [Peribacillus asahii]USK87146.1 hypothetical protein LIT35_11235 [Peribacillus asahii]